MRLATANEVERVRTLHVRGGIGRMSPRSLPDRAGCTHENHRDIACALGVVECPSIPTARKGQSVAFAAKVTMYPAHHWSALYLPDMQNHMQKMCTKMIRLRRYAWSGVLLLVAVGMPPNTRAQVRPSSTQDYPQWRGHQRDGNASAFAEPRSWPDNLTLRWRADVGPGYATPIIVGSVVYTHTRRDENEVMLALDATSGKTLWETAYPAPYKMNPATRNHGQGPKATPLYQEGKLFTLGISGIVSAFNASDGKLLWQKAAPSVDPMYGTSVSPIGDPGVVVVHVGGHDQGALTAFDSNTGAVRWAWTGDGPAYASPIIVDLGGTRQLVTVTQKNIVSVAMADGRLLWQRPWVSRSTNNSITPILYGDTLIVTGHELGVIALRPVRREGAWAAEVAWEQSEVAMFMSNPVLMRDTLYGLSHKASGQFFALDAKTGKVLWLGTPREATNTAIVKAGELLFLLNDDAELIVAKSHQAGFEPLKRYTVATSATWAQPAISGNRIFIKDVSSLAMWTVN
jgi:outer membrane protein assembly factor BamB